MTIRPSYASPWRVLNGEDETRRRCAELLLIAFKSVEAGFVLTLNAVHFTQIALDGIEAAVDFRFESIDALAQAGFKTVHVSAVEKNATEDGEERHGELHTEEDGEEGDRELDRIVHGESVHPLAPDTLGGLRLHETAEG